MAQRQLENELACCIFLISKCSEVFVVVVYGMCVSVLCGNMRMCVCICAVMSVHMHVEVQS